MDLTELLRKVLYTEGKDRLNLARKSFDVMIKELPRFGIEEENYGAFAVELIKLFVRADKVVEFEEYTFLSELLNFNLTFEAFKKRMTSPQNELFLNIIDDLIDQFSPEGKEAVCTFGLCLLESDDVLTAEEQKLFDRLLTQ